MQKIQTFAHNLRWLKKNGKLAFRKCIDHNIFRKMFKRNVLSTGKSTAIIPEMEEPFLLTYGRNGYSDISLFRFLSKVNRTHPACISSP